MNLVIEYHPGDLAYIMHEDKICAVTVHEVAISVVAGKEAGICFDIPSFDSEPEVSMNYVVVKGKFQNDPKKVADGQKLVVPSTKMFPTAEAVAASLIVEANKE